MEETNTARQLADPMAQQACTTGVTQARLSTANLAYRAFDFLDARVEGQFAWEPEKDGRGVFRTVFLAPVEAEEGVEMVMFHVRFSDTDSNKLEDVYCLTSAGNRYGRSGDDAAIRQVHG